MATALLFTSCKKDDKDEPAVVTCKLAKSVYFNTSTGARSDSATYTYTGDKITKATSSKYYFNFEYSGDRISKRSGIQTGQTTAGYYQQFTYNSDGTLAKMESFEPSTGGTYAIYNRVVYTYNAGKIQKVEYFEVSGTTAEKLEEYAFTYTGNNVTQVIFTDVTANQSLTVTYTYDTNNNYFKKQNGQVYIIDPFFTDQYGDVDVVSLPFAISANNATGISVATQSATYGYNLDDKQNLKSLSVAGKALVEYGYQCQ